MVCVVQITLDDHVFPAELKTASPSHKTTSGQSIK